MPAVTEVDIRGMLLSGTWRVQLRTVAVSFVALFFTVAALFKLISLESFEQAVRSWEFLPNTAVGPIVTLLPPAELAVGVMWILGIQRTKAAYAMAAMLLAFTALFATHLAIASPPDCGCLGKLKFFENKQTEAVALLVRNSAMFSVVGAWIVMQSRKPQKGAA